MSDGSVLIDEQSVLEQICSVCDRTARGIHPGKRAQQVFDIAVRHADAAVRYFDHAAAAEARKWLDEV